MKKIKDILLTVFSVGVLLTLFAGALALVGFVAALIIGGETATQICVFIHKTYFPYVIRVCSVAVGFGLVGMYLGKMKALSVEDQKEK
jgi:uncharacterized membrane protein AbrB (regulator of aidB expression)